MYRNLVFDIGGVVVNYNPKDFLVDRFYNERTEKRLYDAVFDSEEWRMLDRGEIAWREAGKVFMRRGAEKDMVFEMRTLLEEWTDMLTTRKPTVTLLRLLKKRGFSLYYLSNLSHEVYAMLQKRDFWPVFDGGVVSCEVGTAKPDLGIYRKLLEKYELKPQETIFTDDVKANTAAAFEAGITGIQFKNVKTLCKMLVTYGIEIA